MSPRRADQQGVSADITGDSSPDQVGCPLPQHWIQFVDEKSNRRGRLFGGDRGCEIRTGEFDAALGGEPWAAASSIAFHVDAEAEDSWLMSKQPLGFFVDKGLRGRIEPEVN